MINGAGGVTSGFGAVAAVPNCQTSLMWEVSVTWNADIASATEPDSNRRPHGSVQLQGMH